MPCGKEKGFTLIDLLLVVMILGIAGMILAPQFNTMLDEAKLNEATGELVSGLQYAQNLAVRHQRPFGVLADTDGNWFNVFDSQYKDDSNPHPAADPPVNAYGVVLHPMDKNWYLTDFDTMETYSGVSLSTIPAGGEIRFYPDGHSSSSSGTFVLSLAKRQKTIIVDGVTGRVSVQ